MRYQLLLIVVIFLTACNSKVKQANKRGLEYMKQNQRATAAENVKTDLVLDAIAKAENIQVSMEDVDAELSAIAAQHGATLDEVKNIIKSNGNMGLLLANILRRKAAHVVIDNAK